MANSTRTTTGLSAGDSKKETPTLPMVLRRKNAGGTEWDLEYIEPVNPKSSKSKSQVALAIPQESLRPLNIIANRLDYEERCLVKRLHAEAHALRGWEDADYQRQYAESHMEELLNEAAAIRKAVTEIYSNGRAVEYLKEEHPLVLKRHLGKLQALLIAERLQVGKETPKQWRERQKRHVQTQLEDEKVKVLLAIQAAQQKQDLIDQELGTIRKRKDLTPEQKERREKAILALADAAPIPSAEGETNAANATTILE